MTLISLSPSRIQTLIVLRNAQNVAEGVHLFLVVQQTTVWTKRSLCCAPTRVIAKLCCAPSMVKRQLQFGGSEAAAPLSSMQAPISSSSVVYITILVVYITVLGFFFPFFPLFVTYNYLSTSLLQIF